VHCRVTLAIRAKFIRLLYHYYHVLLLMLKECQHIHLDKYRMPWVWLVLQLLSQLCNF